MAQNAGHVVLVQWHGAQGATGTAGAQTRALQWRLGEWHSFGASQVLETNGNHHFESQGVPSFMSFNPIRGKKLGDSDLRVVRGLIRARILQDRDPIDPCDSHFQIGFPCWLPP